MPQERAGPKVDGAGRGGRFGKSILYAALFLAIAYFAWRGVWRGIMDSSDLAVGYSSGRAWLSGQDPYDAVVLGQDLIAAGGIDVASTGLLDRLLNVYMPGTMPAFAPLALASWPVALSIFLALNVAGALFIAFGLGRLIGWRVTEPRALVLTALVLALAPLQTTASSGQTGILATAALVGALLLERSDRMAWSGVFYGLATVLKVQIGLPFLIYLLWRRLWMAGAFGGLVVGAASLLAVVRMEVAGVPWASSWLANLAALSGPGGINDPGQLNPERYSLINLQVLLADFGPIAGYADALTFGLVAAAGLAMVWLIRGRDQGSLLAISIVAVLTLLVTYHRYYDAVLLAFPIAWALSVLQTHRWKAGVISLVLCGDFVLPAQTALHDLQQRQLLPPWITDSPIWGPVLMVQHVWALVLLVLVLLWAAALDRRAAPGAAALVPA